MFTRQELVQRARARLALFDKIMVDIGEKNWLTREEVSSLQTTLRQLKALFEEDRALDKVKIVNRMEPHEYFYLRSMLEAASRTRVPVNSHPLKSVWWAKLASAKYDVEYYLDRVEKRLEEAKQQA